MYYTDMPKPTITHQYSTMLLKSMLKIFGVTYTEWARTPADILKTLQVQQWISLFFNLWIIHYSTCRSNICRMCAQYSLFRTFPVEYTTITGLTLTKHMHMSHVSYKWTLSSLCVSCTVKPSIYVKPNYVKTWQRQWLARLSMTFYCSPHSTTQSTLIQKQIGHY